MRFGIGREAHFKGERKVGLDSGVIISLIDNPLFNQIKLEIFTKNNLFFTHRICIKEIKNWLIKNRNFSEEKAEKEVDEFIKEYNINIIEIDKSNKYLLLEMIKQCKEAKIKFHPPDSFIIADFKKNGINKIYSTNNHFLDACRLFGMNAIKFPTVEKEIDRQLKRMFKSHHK